MIPGDIATRLRQLTENTVQAPTVLHKLPANLPDLVPGQQFTAQIQNPLPDGSFQALVAGKTITLALPHAVKSGDVLELIVTGQQDESLTAKLAPQQAPLDDAPHSTLSQTGRLISQLLTGRFGEQRTTPLAGGTPLLPSPPDQAQQLAPKLQQAIANSGLFYESHLKAWTEGNTALANLLREPQAKFMPGKTQPASTLTTQTDLLHTVQSDTGPAIDLTASPLHEETTLLQNLLSTTPEETSQPEIDSQKKSQIAYNEEAHGNSTHADSAKQPTTGTEAKLAEYDAAQTDKTSNTQTAIHQENAEGQDQKLGNNNIQQSTSPQRIPDALMPLIYQQLEAMATHQMQYQFEAWPGMNLEWDLIDPDQENGSSDEAEKAWRSHIRLHLPKLGNVNVLLVLGPQGLSIRLDTDNDASAQHMKIAAGQLLNSLVGAGLSVAALSVTEHASA